MKFINNDEKTGKIYITIFTICLFVVVFFAISVVNALTKNMFNTTLLTIYKIELAIATGLVVALIWNEQKKKIILIGVTLCIVALPVTEIVYSGYKNREPLVYLHRKYDFKYRDMTIISKNDALFSSKRTYIIKYNDEKIKLVYTSDDGWSDNYVREEDRGTITEKIKEKTNNIKEKIKDVIDK